MPSIRPSPPAARGVPTASPARRAQVALCVLLASATTAAAQTGGPAPGHRFVDIVDREGFERPVPVTRAEVPADWTATGGVRWRGQGCGFVSPSVLWSAASPDGTSALSQLPQESWQVVAPAPGPLPCQDVDASSTRAFVTGYAARHRPGARVLDFRVNPQSTGQLRDLVSRMAASGRIVTAEVGEALLADEVGGRGTRELLVVPLIVTLHESATMRIASITSLPAVAVRAPAGELDFRAAYRRGGAFVDYPEWGQRMSEYRRRMAVASRPQPSAGGYDPLEAQRKLGQTLSETNDIVANTPSPAVMTDSARREQSEMIFGTETWNRPLGGTVELDASERAWQGNDGTWITSDNPLADPGPDATELEITR